MKKIYYFLFSILAVATTSCSDDLDIKPTSFISDATVWEDQALINKYVANIYGSMLCGFNRCTAGYGQDWSMSWAGNLDGLKKNIQVKRCSCGRVFAAAFLILNDHFIS